MEHPYRLAGAVGAGIAIAAWIASRIGRRDEIDTPYRPSTPVTPRPVTPVTPPTTRPPVAVTPPRPVTPTTPTKRPDLTAEIQAEAATRMAIATTTASDLATPVVSRDSEITSLTRALAGDIAKLSRTGEDFTSTTLRVWREIESEGERALPNQNIARRAGDLVWQSVFLTAPAVAGSHMQLAEWTKTRQTSVITSDRIGTDEMLLRAAVAAAVVRRDAPNPFKNVVELWRRGVVPDVTAHSVVVRRGGVVIASAPALPERGKDVA